jgi:hypothetical protein
LSKPKPVGQPERAQLKTALRLILPLNCNAGCAARATA